MAFPSDTRIIDVGFKTGRLDVFIFTKTERFLVESLVDEFIDHRNDVMVSVWYDYVLNDNASNVASQGRLQLFRGIPDINCHTE